MPTTDLTTQWVPRMSGASGHSPVKGPTAVGQQDGTRTGAPSGASEPATKPAELPEEHLVKTVERLNEMMQTVRRELRFSVHEKTGRTVIEVVDAETQSVVRQIPPEQVLTLMERMQGDPSSMLMDLQV